VERLEAGGLEVGGWKVGGQRLEVRGGKFEVRGWRRLRLRQEGWRGKLLSLGPASSLSPQPSNLTHSAPQP